MARASMAQIIGIVRLKIGDPAGGSQAFTDDQIQDQCDAFRDEIRYELLNPAPDIQPPQGASTSATYVWAAYWSHYQYWENSVNLQGINTVTGKPWSLLTPVTTELIPGRWAFAVELPNIATPPAQYPPVFATGQHYDIYRISAELLLMRIAAQAFNLFNITIDGRNMQLQQIITTWQKLADSYYRQAWPSTIQLRRGDISTRVDMSSTARTSTGLLPDAFGEAGPAGDGGY
jgi:hypothetical protein